MNGKRMPYRTVLAFVVFVTLGLTCGQAAYSQTATVSFPPGFIETWKRDNFNNTLTFTARTVKSSSSNTTWNLTAISGNAYKLNNGKTDMTLTIRLANGNIEISGDSGSGENNWNGTWKIKQSTIVQGANLTAKLVWVLRNAQSNGDYTIEMDGDESFNAQTLVFEGKTNVTLRLTGGEEERTITLTGNGSLFTVASGVTLVLGKGVTLRGHKGNNAPLVTVSYEASLIMNEGSKIIGNTSSSNSSSSSIASSGGGVYVSGTFTMNGGEISGNTSASRSFGYTEYYSTSTFYSSSYSGGGVYVDGTFTMSGGKISGNTSSSYSESSSSPCSSGGGVYVNGSFTMSGGEISGNTSSSSSSGGGVYVDERAAFTMSGGEISGNTSSSGGGVYVGERAAFTMSGGKISDNTASSYGGGVLVARGGTFTMSDGVISGNTTKENGGGVYVRGTITMNGGEVSGNTATENGGGVYVVRGGYNWAQDYVKGGTFTMNGGAVSGNTTKKSGGGVYVGETFIMSSGEISGNTASSGGGVSVDTYNKNGNFTMSNGAISGNTARESGGGVFVSRSSNFTMSNGAISGNTARESGGGVSVEGWFIKKGGTIYGYAEGDSKSNVVKADSGIVQDNKGHAVFIDDSRRRESTTDPKDNPDPNKTGLAGGWGY